jgi:hypothetical protein
MKYGNLKVNKAFCLMKKIPYNDNNNDIIISYHIIVEKYLLKNIII